MVNGQIESDIMMEIAHSLRRPLESSFGPASREERTVFGAPMPGYGGRSIPKSVIDKWVFHMKRYGMKKVCCLLAPSQLMYYTVDLLEVYRKEFGDSRVLSAPIEDYHLCGKDMLAIILGFLKQGDSQGEPVVVHCAGGRGRTGFVHAAWLVHGRGFSLEKSFEAVQEMGRDPFEAVKEGNAREEDLHALLQCCQYVGTVVP